LKTYIPDSLLCESPDGIFRDLVKRYDGESWREILRRHPRSPEAVQARQRLDALAPRAVR
jgi:hypothetical protein